MDDALSNDLDGVAFRGPTMNPLTGLHISRRPAGQPVSTTAEYRLPEPVTLEDGDLLYFALDREQGKIVGYLVQRADGTVERHIDE